MNSLLLTGESLALLSDAVSPALFTVSFLAKSGGFTELEETEVLRMPAVTRITYGDAYVFQSVPGSIQIEHNRPSEASERIELDSLFAATIRNLVTATSSFLSVRAAGVNFRFVRPSHKLSAPADADDTQLRMSGISFVQKLESCDLNINVVGVQHAPTGELGTQFEFNFHFATDTDDASVDLPSVLGKREELFTTAQEALNAISTVYTTGS